MLWFDDERGLRLVCPIPDGASDEEISAIMFASIQEYVEEIHRYEVPGQLTIDLVELEQEEDEG